VLANRGIILDCATAGPRRVRPHSPDDVRATIGALSPVSRQGVWCMRRATFAALHALKTGDGRPR